MPEPVYSTQFIFAPLSPDSTIYRVPDGFRAIVRDVECSNPGYVAPFSSTLSVDDTLGWLHFQFAAMVAATEQWHGHVVLNPGQFLRAASEVPVDWLVSGYLLSLP